MKFPYGISDFFKLVTEGYFYLDRTDHIPLIEAAGSQLLFLRPRRFGKSLLLSMLENYYDVAKADEFQRLFGHLYIGQNPTLLHNQYFVLKWDFSGVSPLGDAERIERTLHDYINGCIERFVARYRGWIEYDIMFDVNNALRSFQSLLAAIERTPYRLYLLIDEYDHFAKALIGEQPQGSSRYTELLHAEGVLKMLFKAVKAASSGRGLDRAFISGVLPVTLSDVSSGYNIAVNTFLQPNFQDLCGFCESEVTETLQQVVEACGWPADKTAEALEMMRASCNGYRFSYTAEEPIYNPTLALHFFEALQRERQHPRNLLDGNLAMDRNEIAYVAQLPNGEGVVKQALDGGPPLSVVQLADRFGVEDMLHTVKDRAFMISLLYYSGMLTLAGYTSLGKLAFRIPNQVVRGLYVE